MQDRSLPLKNGFGAHSLNGNSAPNYEARYAEGWSEISALAKEATGHRCVLCDRKAVETHHALYADGKGAIAGREIPGVHVFPLCGDCHKEAHSAENWTKDPIEPVTCNCSTERFYKRLRKGWLERCYPVERTLFYPKD